MNCSRCGAAVAAGSNFCPRCGAPLGASRVEPVPFPPPMPTVVFEQPRPRKKVDGLAMAMLGVAIAIVGFLGLAASGVLKIGPPETGPVTVVARGDKKVPVLQVPATQPQMPRQVRDYLEHVQRIEERKNTLAAKQMSHTVTSLLQKGLIARALDQAADPGLDDPQQDPPETTGTMKSLVADWQALLRDFQAVPSPYETRPLSDDYFQALSEIPAWVADIDAILADAGKPPAAAGEGPLEKLMALQNTSQATIDEKFADADDKLAQICDQFETRKWFDIRPDVGGGLTAKLGL